MCVGDTVYIYNKKTSYSILIFKVTSFVNVYSSNVYCEIWKIVLTAEKSGYSFL